jgi:hypothetical protein
VGEDGQKGNTRSIDTPRDTANHRLIVIIVRVKVGMESGMEWREVMV